MCPYGHSVCTATLQYVKPYKKFNILLNVLISPNLIRGVNKDNINPADYICI